MDFPTRPSTAEIVDDADLAYEAYEAYEMENLSAPGGCRDVPVDSIESLEPAAVNVEAGDL